MSMSGSDGADHDGATTSGGLERPAEEQELRDAESEGTEEALSHKYVQDLKARVESLEGELFKTKSELRSVRDNGSNALQSEILY